MHLSHDARCILCSKSGHVPTVLHRCKTQQHDAGLISPPHVAFRQTTLDPMTAEGYYESSCLGWRVAIPEVATCDETSRQK